MNSICWKGKAFKALSFGRKCKKAGRNFSGNITIFHRGGGSKKLIRRLDFQRLLAPSKGIIERIEYDPNRTARIALVRWFETERAKPFLKGKDFLVSKKFFNLQANNMVTYKNPTHFWYSSSKVNKRPPFFSFKEGNNEGTLHRYEQEQKEEIVQIPQSNFTQQWNLSAFSYILACDKLKSGDEIFNLENKLDNEYMFKNGTLKEKEASFDVEHLFQKSGNSLPLSLVPLGSRIYNIENFPGSGGKLVRSAGTSAQLIQKMSIEPRKNFDYEIGQTAVPGLGGWCLIRLPSGQHRSIDMRCRATLGIVSNVEHDSQKLRKAGQNRWRGFRPVVRGVAMNPIDHPHGGGEGRTKGGRPSVSPWGKPAKGSKRKVK